jgi:phage shock protein C
MKTLRLHDQWTRSSEGWLAGVCQGLGERFDINPGLLRLIWFVSIFFFGVGLFLYFVCAFVIPVEGKEDSVLQPKVLGVCLRLADRLDVDVTPLRILSIFALMGSFGTILFVYIALHFLLPQSSRL